MTELYRKYRPTRFKDVVGQDPVVKALTNYVKEKNVPHAILYTGQTGGGKTTFARILKLKLDVDDADFFEHNCADYRGIDLVRDLRAAMNKYATKEDGFRMYLLDECHQLTKEAQSALLKLLEDPKDHCYFQLCTTNPEGLLPTIKNRCTHFTIKPLNEKHLTEVVDRVLGLEKKKVTKTVMSKLLEFADGSARKILVDLEKVLNIEDEEDQLNSIFPPESEKAGIDIARAIIAPKPKWSAVAAIIKELSDPPETVKSIIMSYALTILLNGGPLSKRAQYLIENFEGSYLPLGKPGYAVLASKCYDACIADI